MAPGGVPGTFGVVRGRLQFTKKKISPERFDKLLARHPGTIDRFEPDFELSEQFLTQEGKVSTERRVSRKLRRGALTPRGSLGGSGVAGRATLLGG